MSKEEDNKAIVGRWFTDFWGKICNLAIVDELAAPEMLLKYSLHEPRRGREDIKAFQRDFRRAFPDLNFWGTATSLQRATMSLVSGKVAARIPVRHSVIFWPGLCPRLPAERCTSPARRSSGFKTARSPRKLASMTALLHSLNLVS